MSSSEFLDKKTQSASPAVAYGAQSFSTPNEEPPPPAGHDDPVPRYSAVRGQERIAAMKAIYQANENLKLPVLAHPKPLDRSFRLNEDGARIGTEIQIVNAFYALVNSKDLDGIAAYIREGLVSPDVTDSTGATPLLMAVNAGHVRMARLLGQLGADVNAYGTMPYGANGIRGRRTALHVAAAKGHLILVKCLMEEFGADDSLVAPDGQLALRLAAANGHREIVAYLPARRGGGLQRWKVQHAIAIRRARSATRRIGIVLKCLFWYLPKAIFWWIPKYGIVIPARDAARFAWKNRRRFGGWCRRQAVELPGRLKKVGREALEGAKKMPSAAKSAAKDAWKAVKKIPGGVRALGIWMWGFIKALSRAAASIAGRTASLLHSASVAVATFFRELTLRDLWNGLCDVLSAVFVTFPKAFWSSMKEFGEVSYKVLDALLGNLGKFFWMVVAIIIYVAKYVPSKLVDIMNSLGRSAAKGVHEMLIFINPKV